MNERCIVTRVKLNYSKGIYCSHMYIVVQNFEYLLVDFKNNNIRYFNSHNIEISFFSPDVK